MLPVPRRKSNSHVQCQCKHLLCIMCGGTYSVSSGPAGPPAFTVAVCCCSDYARPCAPETPLSAQEIANATLPEDIAEDFADKMPKDLDLLLPMNSAAGTCNSYLPNGPTTLPRFLWVVEYLVANGMYVLVSVRVPEVHGQRLCVTVCV